MTLRFGLVNVAGAREIRGVYDADGNFVRNEKYLPDVEGIGKIISNSGQRVRFSRKK